MFTRKVLPLKYPSITSYQTRAGIYALAAAYPQMQDWLMENFIQMETSYEPEDSWFRCDFINIPHIIYSSNYAFQTQSIFYPVVDLYSLRSEHVYDLFGSIVNLIKFYVSKEYYLFFHINTKYLSIYKSSKDFPHDIFVFGYDDSDKKVFVADFFVDGKYSFETCSYDEIENAFLGLQGLDIPPSKKSMKEINIISISASYNYKFNIDRFKFNLEGYLNIDRSIENIWLLTNCLQYKNAENQKFGNYCFDNMSRTIKEKFLLNDSNFDLRAFQIMCDHKYCILERIDYLKRHGFLANSDLFERYGEIKKRCETFKNIIIKAKISKKFPDINKVSNMIMDTKTLEYEILLNLLNHVNVNKNLGHLPG